MTSKTEPHHSISAFNEIQERGGNAALDFKNDEMVLICTKPTSDPKTWGRGAVAQTYVDILPALKDRDSY